MRKITHSIFGAIFGAIGIIIAGWAFGYFSPEQHIKPPPTAEKQDAPSKPASCSYTTAVNLYRSKELAKRQEGLKMLCKLCSRGGFRCPTEECDIHPIFFATRNGDLDILIEMLYNPCIGNIPFTDSWEGQKAPIEYVAALSDKKVKREMEILLAPFLLDRINGESLFTSERHRIAILYKALAILNKNGISSQGLKEYCRKLSEKYNTKQPTPEAYQKLMQAFRLHLAYPPRKENVRDNVNNPQGANTKTDKNAAINSSDTTTDKNAAVNGEDTITENNAAVNGEHAKTEENEEDNNKDTDTEEDNSKAVDTPRHGI